MTFFLRGFVLPPHITRGYTICCSCVPFFYTYDAVIIATMRADQIKAGRGRLPHRYSFWTFRTLIFNLFPFSLDSEDTFKKLPLRLYSFKILGVLFNGKISLTKRVALTTHHAITNRAWGGGSVGYRATGHPQAKKRWGGNKRRVDRVPR